MISTIFFLKTTNKHRFFHLKWRILYILLKSLLSCGFAGFQTCLLIIPSELARASCETIPLDVVSRQLVHDEHSIPRIRSR